MAGRKKVFVRIAVIIGSLALLIWFFVWNTSRLWQYEMVQQGILYRCSARSDKEFISAALRVYPQGLVITGTAEQLESEVINTARNYGHKNRTRVLSLTIPPGETPSAEQVARFIDYIARPARQPVLLVDTDGRSAGMLTAAYRLTVLGKPLAEVEREAALDGAPAETIASVQRFARQYAQAAQQPAISPATKSPAPELPLGPALPE